MRKGLIGLCAAFLCGVLAMEDAEARRFGGGRSVGVQRSVPQTPPAATPARPAQQQAAPATQQTQASSGASRWGPMLGGLALGGLLGYLFAGNGLVGLLALALLAFGIVLLIRALARRASGAPQRMQYAGFGQDSVVAPAPPPIGGSAVSGARLPAGFDAAAFLRGAKMNFVKLQLANDRGSLEEIREFTTDELFEEIARDVAGRGAERQQTDIESLQAEIVDVATEGERHWVSVRFSGRAREAAGAAPIDFAEVWNLVKPADGSSGWLLAGIQQMH